MSDLREGLFSDFSTKPRAWTTTFGAGGGGAASEKTEGVEGEEAFEETFEEGEGLKAYQHTNMRSYKHDIDTYTDT